MNKCSFLKGISNEESYDIKIEIHHYPFSLADIVNIVIKKRQYYNESLDVQMVAKEVMQRHYELLVGLIPLSKTVHKLVHSESIFIPIDKALGNWQRFMDIYSNFMSPEQADVIERIIEYSKSYNKELNEEVLKQNTIYLSSTDPRYQLPDFHKVYDNMIDRIGVIKENQYRLPEVTEAQYAAKKEELDKIQKEKINPIIYVDI
jgi:hypothetical protein